jgi:hypothetical protein
MKRLVLGIVCLLLIPAWSSGAAQTGTIKGSVVDSSGRPVVGAVVQMATVAPGTIDAMKFSDGRGAFAFENLVPGEYLVHVTKPLFSPTQKEKIIIETGANATASLRFHIQTIEEVRRRAASRDAKKSADIIWALQSSRGTQSVLKFSDSPSPSLFRRLLPDYSGYIQFYSKADPGARAASNTMGSRFSVTLGGLPADAKVTFSGQYNESPLEPKGASALYEFKPSEGHESRIGLNVRQGVVLDDTFSGSTAAMEELKEFQFKYSDKFNLTETIIIENGAEIGHAEGRASNNYLRPRGSVSWVPNGSTVFTLGVSTQAPGQEDDPVRGREYFEQVNLPPSHEHYLHTEIGVSRFLDDSTKVSMAVFQDRANYRAMFVTTPDGRRGLLIFDGRATPSQGMRFFANREFYGFEAGLGYTAATGAGLPSRASSLDDLRQQVSNRQFHVVTARLKTDFELTNTELTAVYRWISRNAAGPIDPYQGTLEYNDPTLSISVAQNLPTFGNFPGKVQAIFDARNLFDQSFGSSRNQLAHSPRFVKGGINIRF